MSAARRFGHFPPVRAAHPAAIFRHMQNRIPPRLRTFACTAALLAAAVAPVVAQDATAHSSGPAPRRWVGLDAAYTSFSGGYDAWKLASVSLANRSAWGTAIGRVNYASRYATDGLQVEGDLYPRLGPSTYLYLNLGYGSYSVFPQWRSGAELFQSLPDAWEASAGYRQLRFNGTPVTLLTGAVGKYAGNYWVSLRPYVRAQRTGTTASVGLTARRYGADADDYVGLAVNGGTSPTDQLTPDAVGRLHSASAALTGSGRLSPRFLGTWSAEWKREELAAQRFRTGVTLSAGLDVIY